MTIDSVPSLIEALERAPRIVTPLVGEVPPAILIALITCSRIRRR
jgi:hypothetical protein